MDLTCPLCGSGNIDDFIIAWGTCMTCGHDAEIEEFQDTGAIIDGYEIMKGEDR